MGLGFEDRWWSAGVLGSSHSMSSATYYLLAICSTGARSDGNSASNTECIQNRLCIQNREQKDKRSLQSANRFKVWTTSSAQYLHSTHGAFASQVRKMGSLTLQNESAPLPNGQDWGAWRREIEYKAILPGHNFTLGF